MEIQEIKIDGAVYVAGNTTSCKDCALSECDGYGICVCSLFNGFALKVKEGLIKEETVSLPKWQLEGIYEALRLTLNGNSCSGKDVAFDRVVRKAMSFMEPLIKGESSIEIKG